MGKDKRSTKENETILTKQTPSLFANNDDMSKLRVQFVNGNMADHNRAPATRDHECYFNKLTLADGDRLPDTSASYEWAEDVTKQPNIQWLIYTCI